MSEEASGSTGLLGNIDQLIAENEFDDATQITDSSNARLLVDLYGHLLRYAVDAGRWYVWTSKCRWEPEDKNTLRVVALTKRVVSHLREGALDIEDDTIRQRTLNLIGMQEALRKRRDMIKLAASDPRVQCSEEDFDADPYRLACTNGVVNLTTGELQPCMAKDMNSRQVSAPLVAAAVEPGYAPELDLFLDTFIPSVENQRFVFAVLGWSLRGGNSHRLLPIFWGPTTTGKSQLFEALRRLLGSYVCTIGAGVFRGNLDDKPRPDLVHAMFTRIAYATEAAQNWALHADQVKRLTGGDALPYRDLFEGMVNRKPRFTPIIVANEFPRITGADNATKRRILAIRLGNSLAPGQEDPAVKERFLADARTYEGLLARLVAGARDDILGKPELWPEEYTLATMAARADIDHTDEFLEWARDEGLLLKIGEDEDAAAHTCIKASTLHSIYGYWLKKHCTQAERQDRLGLHNFGRALRDKGWESTMSAGTRWLGWRTPDTLPMWINL